MDQIGSVPRRGRCPSSAWPATMGFGPCFCSGFATNDIAAHANVDLEFGRIEHD